MAQPKKQNDFDANELIKASEDHEKSLAELGQSVKKLEARVGDNAALAKSFREAFDNDKKMDEVLTGLICELIEKNDSLKDAVKTAVRRVDRDWWNRAGKKGLTAVGAIVLVALGAFLQAWLGA